MTQMVKCDGPACDAAEPGTQRPRSWLSLESADSLRHFCCGEHLREYMEPLLVNERRIAEYDRMLAGGTSQEEATQWLHAVLDKDRRQAASESASR